MFKHVFSFDLQSYLLLVEGMLQVMVLMLGSLVSTRLRWI